MHWFLHTDGEQWHWPPLGTLHLSEHQLLIPCLLAHPSQAPAPGTRSTRVLSSAQNYPMFDLSTAEPGQKARLSGLASFAACREQPAAAQHARCPPAPRRLLLTAVLEPWKGQSHFFFSSCPFLPAQCLLLLASLLILAAPGHSVHTQTLNTFKKSPSNTSSSVLKRTSR